ncbi:tyrosine-type recombinase/integrase [Kitasatospora sp. NPDC048239]|uniref:tyrosine-type recombinase/integrase n=1 Tax=Kitasatospora sp. NPDC048239 TaxID=3364046 RepID=UPI00371434AC
MAGYIEDRWLTKRPDPETGKRRRTALWGKGKRYRVAGIPGVRSRSFETSGDAKKWKDEASVKKSEGKFVDSRDGQVLLGDYIETTWWPSTEYPPSSRSTVRSRVWNHVIPLLGHLQLNEIDYEVLKQWRKDLLRRVASSSAQAIWAHLNSILEAARKGRRIAENPCREHSELRPEAGEGRKAKAWARSTVDGIRDGLPEHYRVLVDLGAGLGLRQGEALGLGAEDFDWEAGTVFVQRQLRHDVHGRAYYCLPKGKKTRRVPVAPRLAARIREHLAQHTPVSTTLPWQDPEEPLTEAEVKQRRPRTAHLLVVTGAGEPVGADVFNRIYWKPALESAGVIARLDLSTLPPVKWRRPKKTYGDTREHGYHCLRHTYASVNLGAGEAPAAVCSWMGHASLKITLEVYGHMVPGAVQRGLAAIDDWFDAPQPQNLPQDSLAAALARWAEEFTLVGAGGDTKAGMNKQFKRVNFVEEPESPKE